MKKHNLKLGLYYSHWIDWEHPNAWDHTKEISGLSAEDYDRYWQEKVLPQMRELLTNYGDIGIIWFDMWIHHSKTVVTKEQLFQLKKLIRELQPDCLINSRLGLSIEEDAAIDFRTLGDNQLGKQKLDYPWQTPATVAHSWGYHAEDSQWKSTTTLLKSLIGNVSLNGNFMLNIGPRANGEVPYEIKTRLKNIGQWLQRNGASIYGSGAFDLRTDLHDWGKITYSDNDPNQIKVYLHVFNSPLNKQLKVTGITSTPTKVYFLADENKKAIPFIHQGALTTINLSKAMRDPYVSVFVMEFDKTPNIEKNLVAINRAGGFALNFDNATHSEGNAIQKEKERHGTIPAHLLVNEKHHLKWRVYIDQPGSYQFDTSYSFQKNAAAGTITLKSNEQTQTLLLNPTGKTIGEPLQNWVIDNFKSHRVGEITFEKTGVFEIEIQLKPNTDKMFQWQWLWVSLK